MAGPGRIVILCALCSLVKLPVFTFSVCDQLPLKPPALLTGHARSDLALARRAMSATPPLNEPFRQIRLSQIWQDLLSPVDALVAYSEILREDDHWTPVIAPSWVG